MQLHRSKWIHGILGILIAVGCLAGAASSAEQSSCIEPSPPTPPNAVVVPMTKFNASVTDVGIDRGEGNVGGVELRMAGKFTFTGLLDLGASTVTLDDLMLEEGGFGELVVTVDRACFLPLPLLTREGGEADKGLYETRGSFRPQVRFQVQNRDPDKGEFEFRLNLDRGHTPDRPELCTTDNPNHPTTILTTRFTFHQVGASPVVVETVEVWRCTNPGRHHMRAPE